MEENRKRGEHEVRITNKEHLPDPIVNAVIREHAYKPKQYSVTALIKGTCQTILERRHSEEIEQDASEMIWLLFGTAVHSVLEQAQETANQLKENKLVIEMPNGYKLSGIFDLYDDATGTVTDYKTASVNKVLFNDWEDYRKQTLIYCWMLRKIGFNAHRGEIVALLKDHSKTKALQGGDYPQHPVYRISWDFTEQEFEAIQQFIYDRFEEIERLEKVVDAELPECGLSERWHTEDKWAIMKKGNKKATKLFVTEGDAQAYMDNMMFDPKVYRIEKREGMDNRCDNYCNVSRWCPYYRSKHECNSEDNDSISERDR